MLTQTEARIYLAANRRCTQTEGARSLHTYNSPDYPGADSKQFGIVAGLDEDTLSPGRRMEISVKSPMEIILIPIVGGLELLNGHGESVFVSSGETFRFLAFPESGFSVVNPFEKETISYVRIVLQPDLSEEMRDHYMGDSPLTTFSFGNENILLSVFATLNNKISGYLGQYDGRAEDIYHLKGNQNGILVFIIHGAFEVQNRLLEKGDALTLQYLEKLEFEALSNKAIILVVEVRE